MNGLDSLIDAVVSNPILSAVLIWIGSVFLSRLFKNKEEDPQKKQERNQRRGTEAEKPARGTSVPVRENAETVQSAYERVQEEYGKRVRNGIKEPEIEKIPGSEKHSVPKTSRQHQALQGIVWAEIIGKPRAVNPHHTRHRRIRP